MIIECNEISQIINELLIAFQDCNKIKNSDLRKMVDLIAAVNTCANGGPDYNTITSDVYEPVANQIVTLPINSFHAVSIMIVEGNIIRDGVTYPTGSVLNYEVTNLNQTPLVVTITAGSKIVIDKITL